MRHTRPLNPLSALCALALLLTLTPAAHAAGFTDATPSDWFYEAVNWAVANDITSGTSPTAFSPTQTCNNAQILTFLWRAAGKPTATGSSPFRNISPNDYYYQPALWASEKGLISGSAFDATAPCTRAMAVTYIWKAKDMPFSTAPASFSDVPAEQMELSMPVAWAVENGITSGTGNNAFSPNKTCSRAEIVTFLLRAYGSGAAAPSTGTQPENNQATELLRLINAERKKAGLPELKASAGLANAARMRADDLSKGYFDNRPDGSDWSSVISAAGIAAEYVDESIIGGSATASDAFAIAMQTPEAYAAMHTKEYTHAAAGYIHVSNGYGGYQDFWSILYIIAEPSAPGSTPPAESSSSFAPVPMKDLANLSSLQKKATDEEFAQAYDKAVELVRPLAGLSREEQLKGIASALRDMVDSGEVEYSSNTAHYNDPYGYFVLGVSSCAGCTRATGLCLNILGIPYEHVNENQYTHQWCRVNVNGAYWICDAYGLYCGPEPAPYQHPIF